MKAVGATLLAVGALGVFALSLAERPSPADIARDLELEIRPCVKAGTVCAELSIRNRSGRAHRVVDRDNCGEPQISWTTAMDTGDGVWRLPPAATGPF